MLSKHSHLINSPVLRIHSIAGRLPPPHLCGVGACVWRQVNGEVANEVAVSVEVELFHADPVHASVDGVLEVDRR